MSNTFTTTRDSLIIGALHKCLVLSEGATPEPAQVSQAATQLEWFLKHLQATTELRWNMVQRNEVVPAGTTDLVLTNSEDIIDIYNVFLRDSGGNDTPVRLVDQNLFDTTINQKSTDVALPSIAIAQFDRDVTTNVASVSLTFYPKTPESYTIYYRAIIKQANAGIGTAEMVADELWMDVIQYGLASRLADNFGLSIERCTYLHGKYKEMLEDAQRKSHSTKDTFFLYPV